MRPIQSNGFTEAEVLEAYYGPDLLYVFRFGLYTYDLVFQRFIGGIEDAKSVNDADGAVNEIFSCKVDRDEAGEIDWLNSVIGAEVWMGMPRAGADGDPYAKYLVNLYEPKTHPFSIDQTSRFYQLQAYDLSQRLRDSELEEPWVIDAGTPYFDAIAEILTAGGFDRQNITVPDLVLPEPRTFAIGEGVTLLTVLDGILEAINCIRHPEPNGSYTVRPWLDPRTTGAGITYKKSDAAFYSERSLSLDSFEGYNKVTMTSSSPEREGETWTAVAENDDMSSPLYKGNRGGRVYNKTFTGVEAASFQILQDKCARQELQYRNRYVTVEMSTRIAPWHGPHEIVQLDDPDLLPAPTRFEEKHWELEYKQGSRMQHGFSNKPRSMSAAIGGNGGGGGGVIGPGRGKRGNVVLLTPPKLARTAPTWDGAGNAPVIFDDDWNVETGGGPISGPFARNPNLGNLVGGERVVMLRLANTWYVNSRVTSL